MWEKVCLQLLSDMFFFWLNILVKPKVTVGLEANEVNLMIIQIRLCLLLNTGWQCSYNSIWKKKNKIIAGPQCCLSLITQVIIRAHVFCNSFVRNEKKIKKNKQTKKKNKRRKGKGKEKKRKLVHKHYATLAWGNWSRLLTSRTRTLSN